MTDIKETIQGLYALKTYLASKAIEEHGQARESLIGLQKVIDSAVNLLKEKEAKHVQNIGQLSNCESGLCPNCGNRLNTVCNKNFCGDCGQAVKWE